MNKVSIITPLLDKDIIYLKECMESIESQVYKNYEWIIIHDESLDISDIISKSKTNIEIIQVKIEGNITIGTARNKGIEAATGKYIYFLDVDDYILAHTLYCLIEIACLNNDEIVMGKIKSTMYKQHQNLTYSYLLDRFLNQRYIEIKHASMKQMRKSCLNILIDREFILSNKIKFDEEAHLYSELKFIVDVWNKSSRVLYDSDAIYFKRKRNDTIRFPSLTKRYKNLEYMELPLVYLNINNDLEIREDIKIWLDKFIIKNYYSLSKQIYINNFNEIISTLDNWKTAFKLIEEKLLKKKNKSLVNRLKIQEIVALRHGRIKENIIRAKFRINVSKFKKDYLTNKSTIKKSLYRDFFSKLSVKNNYILYESFLGRNMSDSPKYIYKYIRENYPKEFKHIWVLDEFKDDLPNDVVQIKRLSLNHLYYLSRSRYWVNNMRQPKFFIKKDNQIFLETWHGTPLKKLVFDMDDVYSPNKNYKQDFYEQSRAWDYLISANEYSTEIFKRAFLYDKPILEIGYPRNDLLYHKNSKEISENLKEKLNIPLDKKIVLYAPTWRDDEYYGRGKYKFKLQLDLKKIREKLGSEYYFIVRTHYLIADKLDIEGLDDFVYNASKYDDVTELYLISDILITDYSSVFFDYANLKRPMIFFTYDLDKYRDTLRGFYLDMEKHCPGPIVMNNDDLIKYLSDYNKLCNDYKEKINDFYNRFCYLEDGKAAERVSEEVIIKSFKGKVS